MELAEHAGLGLRGLPRMEERVRPAADTKLEVERAIQRLEDALRGGVSAFDDPAEPPALVRKLLARRQVDARDLEETDGRSRRCRAPCAPPRRGPGGASCAGSPGRRSSGPEAGSRPGSGRRRRGSTCTPRTAPRRRARPRRGGEGAGSWLRRPRTCRRSGSVCGTRSSTARATSSTTSISRVTSRARQVGTVTSQSSPTSNPKPSRVRSCSPPGTSIPITWFARSGRNRTTGLSGRPEWTSECPVIRAPARSTIRRLARIAAGSARYGSTPFSQRFEPAVRSTWRSEERRMPSGSKFAASRRSSVVSSETSLSSPPMIAAKATARSASAITRSSGSSCRCVPSSVRSSSPGRARRTTIRPPESFARSNACSGLP